MAHSTYQQIGIVGAGRVACALACALAPHSARPLLVWTRDRGRRAASVEACSPTALVTDRLADVADNCDLVILAVADDALAGMVRQLADLTWAARPFVAHVSGRSGVAPLDLLSDKVRGVAAIHPAMTFTGDALLEAARMATARFAITGSGAAALDEARGLVACLGGTAVPIAEEHRALYHAALCHGANHLVTLITGACRGLAAAGVAEPAAVLAPLVRAALENSLADGFSALSGPLLRGDRQTIAQHIHDLERDCPSLLPAYQAMAQATLDELDRVGPDLDRAGLHDALDGWSQM